MNKNALISQVLAITSHLTGLSVERITGNHRDAESTDARYIAATLLHQHGLYPSQIASCLHRSPRSIRWLLARATTSMLRSYLAQARTLLSTA